MTTYSLIQLVRLHLRFRLILGGNLNIPHRRYRTTWYARFSLLLDLGSIIILLTYL